MSLPRPLEVRGSERPISWRTWAGNRLTGRDGAGDATPRAARGVTPNAGTCLVVICALAATGWTTLAAYHAWHYHLLADDYALIAQASDASYRQIFTSDLFSFYRPFTAALVKTVAWIMTPSHGGWSVLMLALHVGNTVLLTSVSRRLWHDRHATWFCATVFLVSPWAAEAYLWLGAIFDVAVTGATLAAVRFGLEAARRARGAGTWWLATAVTCTLAAGFKEHGLLSPFIVAGVLLADNPRVGRSPQAWTAGALATAGVVLVFMVRGVLVDSTSTYTVSAFGALLGGSHLVATFGSAALALTAWPVPHTLGPLASWLNVLLVWPVGFALLPTCVAGLLLSARRAAFLAAVAAGSYAPTAFLLLTVSTITPRRYIYLAGAWGALLLGWALSRMRMTATADRTVGLVASAVLAAATASVAAQILLWVDATRIARCAVEDFGRVALGRGRPIYVDNVPVVVDSGPLVLLEYDFHYAYRPHWEGVDVVYRTVSLHLDESGRYSVAGHGEAPVGIEDRERLSLDLCGVTAPGVVP